MYRVAHEPRMTALADREGMIGGQPDETADVLDVGVGLFAGQPLAFVEAGVEGDGPQTLTEHPPGRVDAAGTTYVDEWKRSISGCRRRMPQRQCSLRGD